MTPCSKRSLTAVLLHGSPAWVVLLVGCGREGIGVPLGPHRPDVEEAPLRVSEPPPPAEIEVVPLRRNDECFYLDGHYENRAAGWVWVAGAWVHPPPSCYYAPPKTGYEKVSGGTTLVHRPGVWLPNSREGDPCPEPRPCVEDSPELNLQR